MIWSVVLPPTVKMVIFDGLADGSGLAVVFARIACHAEVFYDAQPAGLADSEPAAQRKLDRDYCNRY